MSGKRPDLFRQETRRFDAGPDLLDRMDHYVVEQQREGWELSVGPGHCRENPEAPGVLVTFYWRRRVIDATP